MPTLFGASNPYLTLYLPLAALTITLFIGIPMAVRVFREAKGEVATETPTEADLLGPLTEAFEAGQMSEEEYLRIKASIMAGSNGLLGTVNPKAKGKTPFLPDLPEPIPKSKKVTLSAQDELLRPITQAFLAGHMSKEEYHRIKASILGAKNDGLSHVPRLVASEIVPTEDDSPATL